MRFKNEEGQSIILVAVAMSIFLIGAVGLGFDGSQLYEQRNLAQNAADSAAIAGALSIFNGTTGASGTGFATSGTLTCSTTDARTPCVYAIKNGFGTSADTVTIDFPSSVTGVTLSPDPIYAATAIRVNVARNVNTTLMRLLGATVTTVKATATAAIVSVTSPVPIIVMHPSLQNSLDLQGTPGITICGGPHRSIMVNSSNTTAAHQGGSASIDLSHAGPPDPGNCTTGTGADLAVRGGPTSLSGVSYGTTGRYIEPASVMPDPLLNVSAPSVPAVAGSFTPLANGVSGCPASPKKGCQLYSPGLYTGGIDGKNQTPVFKPGIYYIQDTSGFSCAANCDIYMATGFTDTGAGTTGTGWTGNVLFYNTGPSGNPTKAGAFNLGANGTINLVGSPTSSAYKGILFFQDRTSQAQSHSLGGGGAMTLVGTIYLTNTRATMLGTSAHYQGLTLQGGSGSGTLLQGEIIVDTLGLGGNGSITMDLNSTPSYTISEVALVN